MNILNNIWRKIKGKPCLIPSQETPLTDIPGKLITTRLQYHSSGRMEVVEIKWNNKEYERLRSVLTKLRNK